jgi:hypothetical protein
MEYSVTSLGTEGIDCSMVTNTNDLASARAVRLAVAIRQLKECEPNTCNVLN